MKRFIIIFSLLCGVCLGMGNRPIFKKVYLAWKAGNYTIQQVVDANDVQVANHANLTVDEVKEWKRWKRGVKNMAVSRIKAKNIENLKTTIVLPGLTSIVADLRKEGKTVAEAKQIIYDYVNEVMYD